MAKKYVYFFGAGKAEGSSKMRNLLGGKGCDLAEMTNLKIPVPPGFTITTEVCTFYYANKKKYPQELKEQVQKSLAKVEKAMGAKFGDPEEPPSPLRPLRRPGFHARHDGHHPEPRPEREDRSRA